jgi:hypothetical protein
MWRAGSQPDGRRLATVGPLGTHVRRFPPAASGCVWSHTTDDLFLVHGILSRDVLVSAGGEAQARFLFRMARRQGILVLDVD